MDQSGNARTLSPFDGGPATHERLDEHGNPVITVRICEWTPLRLKWAEALGVIAGILIGALDGYVLYILGVTGPALLIAWLLILMAGGYLAMDFIHGKMLKRTEVVFTPQEFRVKDGTEWFVYDRTLNHRFLMMKHDRAREEREKHDLQIRRAQMRGNVIAITRYYDDSYHIVFDYLGQRFDVVTVYDQKRATAVAARLKACDQVMDTKGKMGEGEVMSPDEQWGEVPGKLPGT
jgi:hypothetical protein